MKIIYLSLSLLLAGCASNSLEKRKAEKKASYLELAAEVKTLVDQGILTNGMSKDAVYIAWGKPSEILEIQTEKGPLTKWLYKGTYYQEQTYWTFKPETQFDYYGRQESAIRSRRQEKSFEPHDYVTAEVDFIDGVVKEWRRRSRPR